MLVPLHESWPLLCAFISYFLKKNPRFAVGLLKLPFPLFRCSCYFRLFSEADVFGKPPCYEEAVQMEDPPPPYSEVLADSRGGTYTKPPSGTSRKPLDSETSKAAPDVAFPERGYSTLIHVPAHVHERWDSLGRMLSTMDLNCSNQASEAQASAYTTLPRGGRTNVELGLHRPRLDDTCALPTAFPVFGRSTAV